jgi:hypothetical protein
MIFHGMTSVKKFREFSDHVTGITHQGWGGKHVHLQQEDPTRFARGFPGVQAPLA